MKNYYFLAGLQRSGNTLLSAILNQNPQLYCSALSPLLSIYWNHQISFMDNDHIIRSNDFRGYDNVSPKIITNYYEHIDKPTIIDREKAWGTPANLRLIKSFITPTPKIIFTTRPILEILTSFMTLLPEESYIDRAMRDSDYWYKTYLSKNDNRCDYMMRPHGEMDQLLMSYNEIIKAENKNVFHIVKYDDIVNEPDITLNKIYEFLELPNYKHDFDNIVKLEKDNDERLGQPSNMHEVRLNLKKVSKKPEDVLSEYVINKYSNTGWGA